jgi:hypothetical protein
MHGRNLFLIFRENLTQLLNGSKKIILLIPHAKPTLPKAIQMDLGVHRKQNANIVKMAHVKALITQKYTQWTITGMSEENSR